jgi:hypothetical protein
MSHSAEFRLRAMLHNAEFRLRAMPHSAEFLNIYPLCHLVWNSSQKFSCRLRAMYHSGESTPPHCGKSRLRAMPPRAELRSRFSSSNRITPRIRIYTVCKTVLVHESGGPVVQFDEKNRGRKSHETVPLNNFYGGFQIFLKTRAHLL